MVDSDNCSSRLVVRSASAITVLLLVAAIVWPTHQLGNTAVFGEAYLWGESSIRTNTGTSIVWFVDGWEVVQHAVFACTWAVALVAVAKPRVLVASGSLLAALVALDLTRAIKVDSSNWVGTTSPLFWIIIAWVLMLCTALVALRKLRTPYVVFSP